MYLLLMHERYIFHDITGTKHVLFLMLYIGTGDNPTIHNYKTSNFVVVFSNTTIGIIENKSPSEGIYV